MNMPDVLRQIIAHKQAELARARTLSPRELRVAVAHAPAVRDFAAALHGPQIRVIAEVKRASPSEGAIRTGIFDPAAIARSYAENGAAAVSVLTDERFFGGHLDHLCAVRATVDLPVLRKDFIIDERQVIEARAAGADAVLLIVAALDRARLRVLQALAWDLGMAALVEAHDEVEVEVALDVGATVIGVNNRDLRTFITDLATTKRLASLVPPDRVLVAESGVHTREDVERLARAGADAVLVGTALMRAQDPAAALRTLVGVPAQGRSADQPA